MAVSGLPTNAGVSILSNDLRDQVKKFCLYGTTSSTSEINFDETSTQNSLSSYLIGKFDVSRAYFDDSGTLTFECPIPYDISSTKWVGAAGLIYIDESSSVETLVAISSMPRFQKTAGIGGTIHYKVPIAGEASAVVFEEMPYVTRQELEVVFNEQHSALAMALDLASIANKEQEKTIKQRFQTGEVTVFNRGIKNGCSIERSADATRNLNFIGGSIFMNGQISSVDNMSNTANVPQNTSDETKYTYVFLWKDGNGKFQVDCTNLGEIAPDDSLTLYKVTVPAGSTEATDAYLDNCAITDLRNFESNYPTILANAPMKYVPLEYDLLDDDYSIDLDVVSFDGGGFQLGYCYANNRSANGFEICLNGTVDNVVVRYTVRKLNL